MRVVADESTREQLRAAEGIYVWPRAVRCCGGRHHVLKAALAPPEGAFVERARLDETPVLLREGLRVPDELHVDVDRRGRVQVYWNGQSWVG